MTLPDIIRKYRSSDLAAILARGAGGTFSLNLVAVVIGFGSHIALANLMGTTHYGAYIYVISWLAILQFVGVLGLDRTIVRFLAVYRETADWNRFRGLFWRSHILVVSAGLLIAGLLALTVTMLRSRMSGEFYNTFLHAAPLILLLVLSLLRQASLQSMKHVVIAQAPELILRPVLITAFVFVAYRASSQVVDGPTAMTLNLLATLVTVAIGTAILFRRLPPNSLLGARTYETKEWMHVAYPLMIVACLYTLMRRIDIFFLGAFWEDSIGAYGAASRMIELIVFGLTAVNGIAAPLIAEAFSNGRTNELNRILRLSAWGIAALCIPMIVGIIVLGKFLLGLFGPGFDAAYIPLVIMAAGQVVVVFAGSVNAVLSMTGQQRPMAIALAMVVVLNVVLNTLLVPKYGAIGAASATAVSLSIASIAFLVIVRRLLGLNPTIFSRSRKNRD